ncbi:MAG: hypothetical protein IJ092_06635 [Atopobiaceae bacterium]|nr:hypothetical protein [Atopobiaceae bacterium]
MDDHDFISDCKLFVTDEELTDDWGCIAYEGDCVLMEGDDIVAVYPKSWYDRRSIDALCMWFNYDLDHASHSLEEIRPFDTPLQLAGLILSVISSNDGIETFMDGTNTAPEPILESNGRHADEILAATARVQREVCDLWNAHIGHSARHR